MPNDTFVYQQIMNDVQAKIRSGELGPTDKLPSLNELATLYACSTQPVKAALRLLQHDGTLQGHQGRGVYVAAHGRAGRTHVNPP